MYAGEGQNIYDYKIEIYKKRDDFFILIYLLYILFDLKLNSANVMVSEACYVDETNKLSILEKNPFTCVDECLDFALE